MAKLVEFQEAAVNRIVARLTDAAGSRRFLLADEVGLGKTLVARGVVEALRDRAKRRGYTVVYVCSNSEIGAQNCGKLCPDNGIAHPAGRLTLLALQSAEIGRLRASGTTQIFSFTPGTSLQVGHATGLKEERRLLMYLVLRTWGRRVNRRIWRDFFRCGASVDSWDRDAKFYRIRSEFERRVAAELQDGLRQEWGRARLSLIDPESGRAGPDTPLRDCLDHCVESFIPDNPHSRKNRNAVIGQLRHGLARVALQFLGPDLTILDEFQRFSDILAESDRAESVSGALFQARSPVLILSATPYRMYTLSHEAEDHHADFIRTYAFLHNQRVGDSATDKMKAHLREFRDKLEGSEWIAGDGTDERLLQLKGHIEQDLAMVMCRTERSWYLHGADKGVCEVGINASETALPQQGEIEDYVHLRRFLLRRNLADWNITDFWKSCPCPLSFMDGHYALVRNLRRRGEVVPTTVLKSVKDLGSVGDHNLKCRLLLDKIFDRGSKLPETSSAGGWKYLWVRPTYTYYRDEFYSGEGPQKYLVFSHWKFVPKAVSIIASNAVAAQLANRKQKESAPLQFRRRVSFYPFDLCYPSTVLARCLDQRELSGGDGDLSAAELYRRAEKRIRMLLGDVGVRIGEGTPAPLWRVVARLESRSVDCSQIRSALLQSEVTSRGEASQHYSDYVRQYVRWLDDTATPLCISRGRLRRLTLIALHSPAVALLRSVESVFPGLSDSWPAVLHCCMNQLRTYFNKPLVRAIIRRHGEPRSRSYTQQALGYCSRAHFQAMLDEYAFVLKNVLQRNNLEAFLPHLGRSMGMWAGQPVVNRRSRTGRICRNGVAQTAHFALAFGDDVVSEETDADNKSRRSAVREAFNSPFWPFVLATTSVGQEGLDFHLYCRDVVHWNLPSNPVDLEQREGRINRYDGLSIRRNIAKDVPIASLNGGHSRNIWQAVFEQAARADHEQRTASHGLHPHWVYQSPTASQAQRSNGEMVRRHLLFYAGSADLERYRALKRALSTYRLVFGQPRQQDIVDRLSAKFPNCDPEVIGRMFAKYTINLSPH